MFMLCGDGPSTSDSSGARNGGVLARLEFYPVLNISLATVFVAKVFQEKRSISCVFIASRSQVILVALPWVLIQIFNGLLGISDFKFVLPARFNEFHGVGVNIGE